MNRMAYEPPHSEVKLVPCNGCGADVTVNANYLIKSVNSCKNCPPKNDKNV